MIILPHYTKNVTWTQPQTQTVILTHYHIPTRSKIQLPQTAAL